MDNVSCQSIIYQYYKHYIPEHNTAAIIFWRLYTTCMSKLWNVNCFPVHIFATPDLVPITHLRLDTLAAELEMINLNVILSMKIW